MNDQHLLTYLPTSPAFSFTFRFPVGWRLREIIEEDNVEIFIAGPRNKANTYSAAFSIRLWPTPVPTAEAAAADFLGRFSPRSDFQLTEQAATLIGRKTAVDVEVSYTMYLPLHSIRSEKTQIQERRIFLPYGDMLFEFIYAATADMYADWLDAFHQLANSLTLVADLPSESYPVPKQPSALQVQEPTTDYWVGEEQDDDQP